MEKVPVNDGGQAFPGKPFEASYMGRDGKLHPVYTPGMTLRDYFAATALNTILSQYNFEFFADDKREKPENTFALFVAKNAYTMADAMLRAREL